LKEQKAMSKYSKDDFFSLDSRQAFIEREAKLRGQKNWPVAHWYTDEAFCELYRHSLALLQRIAELEEAARWRDMATEAPTENASPIEIMEFHTAPAIVSEAYSYNDNLHNKGWWYDGGGFVVKEEDVTYWRPLLLPSPQPAKEQK
jgi:hypothetical protein